jgi:hypothetical protein
MNGLNLTTLSLFRRNGIHVTIKKQKLVLKNALNSTVKLQCHPNKRVPFIPIGQCRFVPARIKAKVPVTSREQSCCDESS